MYQYLPIEQAKPGDIVQAISSYTNSYNKNSYIKDNFYIVKTVQKDTIDTVIDSAGSTSNGWATKFFKLVATKPLSEAAVGDTIIRIGRSSFIWNLGEVDTILSIYLNGNLETSSHKQVSLYSKDFVILCKSTEQTFVTKRNIAFYKRSDTPWTQSEYNAIILYTEGKLPNYPIGIQYSSCNSLKFIFDLGTKESFQFLWRDQESNPNFKNCQQVAYEDVFPNTQKGILDLSKYVIDIVGTTLKQRLELRKILVENNQVICENSRVLSTDNIGSNTSFKLGAKNSWQGSSANHNITLVDFIRLLSIQSVPYGPIFSSSDQVYEPGFMNYPNTLDSSSMCLETPTPKLSNLPNKPTQKESTMNDLQQLLSDIFGTDKPTTDYDKRPAILVVVYSLDGKKVATATAESVDQVAQEIQRNPKLWGCKVLTYKLSKELFVDVPVAITKAKIASESEVE